MSGRHDALFKVAFSQPENAAALACCSLSRPMQAFFAWPTMRLHPGSFVNEELGYRHTDLLFEVETACGKVLLYILFEHQSSNDPRMPLRMARYMDRIWERFSSEHPKDPLPAILPLVVSHAPNGWTAPRSFHELFDPQLFAQAPGLARHVPSFELIIDDLRRTSDDDLASRSLANFAKLALWLLRDGRSAELMDKMPRWAKLLEGLPRASLEAIVNYLASVVDDQVTWRKFRAKLHELAPRAEGDVVTLIDQWIHQGETKGRVEGRVEMLTKQLTLKFGELSEAVQSRLASASSDEIALWIERVLFANTVEQVLDESTP